MGAALPSRARADAHAPRQTPASDRPPAVGNARARPPNPPPRYTRALLLYPPNTERAPPHTSIRQARPTVPACWGGVTGQLAARPPSRQPARRRGSSQNPPPYAAAAIAARLSSSTCTPTPPKRAHKHPAGALTLLPEPAKHKPTTTVATAALSTPATSRPRTPHPPHAASIHAGGGHPPALCHQHQSERRTGARGGCAGRARWIRTTTARASSGPLSVAPPTTPAPSRTPPGRSVSTGGVG